MSALASIIESAKHVFLFRVGYQHFLSLSVSFQSSLIWFCSFEVHNRFVAREGSLDLQHKLMLAIVTSFLRQLRHCASS